jgi:hypothetical protein
MMTIPALNSEAEALALPPVRAIYEAARKATRRGVLSEGNAAMVRETLAAAKVDLHAYDERIVDWLAGWEPHVVAAICGWIQRAHGETGEEDA